MQIFENLKAVLKKFIGIDLNLLGVVRECGEVGRSVINQKPIVITSPDSIYAKDTAIIAKKLIGLTVEKDLNSDKMNIFRRIS